MGFLFSKLCSCCGDGSEDKKEDENTEPEPSNPDPVDPEPEEPKPVDPIKPDPVDSDPDIDVDPTDPSDRNDPTDPPERPIVIRKEIRKMSQEEQERFVACVKKLMEGPPGQSEWHRLAGYHGWPQQFCAHRQETFPGWHRAYLLELENALRIADKAIGNDGNMGLPYWDWTDLTLNEVFPKIIRDNFRWLPEKFFEDDNHPIARWGMENRDDPELRDRIIDAGLSRMVVNCLLEEEHYRHASNAWSRDTSVESPHDQVHVAVGWPMTSVEYAAFNPVFWLHHCNVDRIYEKYIEIEKDSQAEFTQFQAMREEDGEANLWEEPYAPFKHPTTGNDFMPVDQFDISELGYAYDELPPQPAQQLNEFPTSVAFLNVDVADLKKWSYEMHVFFFSMDDESSDPRLGSNPISKDDPSSWKKHVSYCGWTALFGGKGESCKNCETTKPVNKCVPITKKLKELGIRRQEGQVRVLTVAMAPNAPERTIRWFSELPMEVLQIIQPPTIIGPYFDDLDEWMQRENYEERKKQFEVVQLQKYLKKYGYFEDACEGCYDEITEKAVREFQVMFQLEVDGIAGPQTKGQITTPRFDDHLDFEESVRNFEKGEKVTYWVGAQPGYMDRDQMLNELTNALSQWMEVAEITFVQVESKDEAQLQIRFTDQSRTNDFLFDGPGGTLAKATKDILEFDASERWELQTAVDPLSHHFMFLPVALHELGHVIGLGHSKNLQDVMAAYYFPDKVKLTENDKERVRNLYPVARL